MERFVEIIKFAANAGTNRRGTIIEKVHFAAQQRFVVKEFDDAKRRTAHAEDVVAAVGAALGDFQNFRCAARASDSVRKSEQHSKRRLRIEAFADHLTIARLKNVQRKISAGEKNNIERKQRQAKIGHRRVPTTSKE